jgi:hypothetical protein
MDSFKIGFHTEQQIAALPVIAAFNAGHEATWLDILRSSRGDCARTSGVEVGAFSCRGSRIVLSLRASGRDADIRSAPIVWPGISAPTIWPDLCCTGRTSAQRDGCDTRDKTSSHDRPPQWLAQSQILFTQLQPGDVRASFATMVSFQRLDGDLSIG